MLVSRIQWYESRAVRTFITHFLSLFVSFYFLMTNYDKNGLAFSQFIRSEMSNTEITLPLIDLISFGVSTG